MVERFRIVFTVLVVVLVAAACSGGSGPETAVDGADTDTNQPSSPAAASGATGDLPSGTITVDGVTHEVSGLESSFRGTTGDFKVCTYRDGGDEGSVTIHVDLSEDEALFVSFGRADGLGPSGRYPTGMDTSGNVEATLEADRASGTVTFDDGLVVEFDVMCES